MNIRLHLTANLIQRMWLVFRLLLLVTLIPACGARSTSTEPCEPISDTWVIDGGPNKFSRPTDLARDALGNLYVIDGGNQRVQKFDCNGKFLMMWGKKGTGDGQFIFLDRGGHFGSLAVDKEGYIYVADHNFRIQKFNSNGKFQAKWGSQGNDQGQFGDYIGLAVDSQGNIYATDPVNNRIQKFDADGKFLAMWNPPKCSFYSPRPIDLVVDVHGIIYVTDQDSHCVMKFDGNGNFLSTVGKFSETDLPTGITIDGQGNLYVTDNQYGIVVKLDSSGNLLTTWDGSDPIYGPFDAPQGIEVDQQGNLYVVEVRGERIRKIQQP